jgi:hypothetical protein
MKTATIEIGNKVNYTNGSETIYNGTIVKTPTKLSPYFVVIECSAGMSLWNAGYAVGTCIQLSQII